MERNCYNCGYGGEVPPTRVCSICDKFENPKATIAYDIGWLCPECKKRLTQMLYPKEGE